MPTKSVPEKKKTTFDLLTDREEIYRKIAESGGELTVEMEEQVLSTITAIAKKADSIQYALEKLEAEEIFLKAQAKSYLDAAKGRAAAGKRLRERIKQAMVEMNQPSIIGTSVEFFLAKAAPGLFVEGLPEGWTMEVTERIADRERIKAALIAGEKIEGCELTGGVSLRTRIVAP